MNRFAVIFFLLFPVGLLAPVLSIGQRSTQNPPAPGFDLQGSDPKAIKIADQVMKAMGGRKAWDETRFIQWNFFGRRLLLWDKWNARVRIDADEGKTVYLLDMATKQGKVLRQGIEVVSDSLAYYLEQAESIWINDAYWLCMPFKLKDSGVTLKYLGRDTIQGGANAEVLQLTFQQVGRTPENKYQIYVDPKTRLVTQWAYYRRYDDEKPGIVSPWTDYRKYGKILLSSGRGPRGLSEIAVYSSVPENVFLDLMQPDRGQFRY